jgi:hypothetical protein
VWLYLLYAQVALYREGGAPNIRILALSECHEASACCWAWAWGVG